MLKEHVQRGADRRAASSDRSVDVAGHQRAGCREAGISQQSCATNAPTAKSSTGRHSNNGVSTTTPSDRIHP